jgi:hypothetical protein
VKEPSTAGQELLSGWRRGLYSPSQWDVKTSESSDWLIETTGRKRTNLELLSCPLWVRSTIQHLLGATLAALYRTMYSSNMSDTRSFAGKEKGFLNRLC